MKGKIKERIANFNNYMKLYAKSLKVVWDASKLWTSVLLLVIPIQALLPAISLTVTQGIMDKLEVGSTQLVYLLVVWGLSFLLNQLATPLSTMVQGQLTDKLTSYLSLSIMRKAEELQSIDFFEDSKFHDDVNLLNSQSSWRPVNLLVFGTSIISQVILLISMFILLADFHIGIALALFIVLIPQGIVSYRIQQQAFETLVSNSEDSRRLTYYSNAVLTPNNIKEVRLYNAYEYFIKQYTDTFNNIRNKVQKDRFKQFLTSAFFLVISAIVSIVSFVYIIKGIQKGDFSVGSILVFSSSIVYAVQGIGRLVEDSSLLYDTLLYMEKFFNFLNLKNTLELKEGINWSDDFETLEVQNVSFKYPNSDKYALKNVSFTIKKGERLAIVGENGSGKSTLIKLICRFYPLTEGNVKYDGINYEDFEILCYREAITAVFQDFSKFELSLRENVTMSNLEEYNNDELIQEALERAGFDEGIELDQALGKEYQDGVELSGGQWQKIAIARAFFSDAPIMILDEPTASIDARTEYYINQRFNELTEGRTVFYITHRLSSVKDADRVLVLKDGEVIGLDSHDVLLETNDYYKEFYQMQAQAYQE